MEYRVAQLEALGRFLEEKKQDILEATALDMRKVRPPGLDTGGSRGWQGWGASPWAWSPWVRIEAVKEKTIPHVHQEQPMGAAGVQRTRR